MTPSATARRFVLRAGVRLIPLALVLALALPKINQGEFNVDTGWYSAIGLQAWREAGEGNPGALWSLPGVGGAPPRGVPYLNKPPLAFWFNGLPLRAFGPHVWAGRLGSVLGAAACALATMWLARAAGGSRSAALATGSALALTGLVIGAARSFSLDIWQAVFLTIVLVPVAAAYRYGRPALLLLSAVGIGLALMTKPLVGLLVLPIVGLWLAWVGRGRWAAWLIGALAIALLIAAPWHLSMWALHGDTFVAQYFAREIADRAAGTGATIAYNRGAESWWYYLRPIGERASPWVFGAVLAAGMWARLALSQRREAGRSRVPAEHPATPWVKLGIVWTLAWLIALSAFPDKRPRYLLMLLPVWAWMSALWLVGGRWRGVEWGAPAWLRRAWIGVLTRWALIVAPVAAIAVALAPVRIHSPEGAHWTGLYEVLAREEHPVYGGGFSPQRSAKVYLALGWWPAPTTDEAGQRIAEPQPGSLVLYHDRDGLAPGPNEDVIYQAERLTATRMGAGAWQPRPFADLGE